MELINYGKLETAIKEMETVLNKYDLEEKQLIIKSVHQRLMATVQNQKTKDMVGTMPLGDIMKRFMKEQGE